VVETKLEAELAAEEEEEEQIPVLEHEMECPRCHGSMALCSDFDSLYYSCDECDFTLYTIKK
jgi:ribosomal protein S27AE